MPTDKPTLKPGSLPPTFAATMPAGTLAPNVIEALQRGNKIEAVRLVRDQTGLGLKEAKDAVDAYEEAHPRDHAYLHARPGDPSPGEVRGGASKLWWIVAALAALLAYFVLRRLA